MGFVLAAAIVLSLFALRVFVLFCFVLFYGWWKEKREKNTGMTQTGSFRVKKVRYPLPILTETNRLFFSKKKIAPRAFLAQSYNVDFRLCNTFFYLAP